MKKQWIIAAVISVVLIAAGFAVGRSLWWVPLSKCSEVYRHYADSPDVSAAYIKDYRVNDTLTLSATVLQAVTDTGWAMLRKDLNIIIHHPDSVQLAEGLDALRLHPGSNTNNELIEAEDVLVISLRDRYACVFENLEEAQRKVIIDAIVDKIFNSVKKNIKFQQL